MLGADWLASDLAALGPRHHPEDEALARAARILSPPQVVGTSPATGTALFWVAHTWAKEHAEEYRGKWALLKGEELLAAVDDLADLRPFKERGRRGSLPDADSGLMPRPSQPPPFQGTRKKVDMHELSPLEPDPIIELYKRDVDRTLLRENLRLPPEERIRKAEEAQAFTEELRRAGKGLGRER